MNNDQLDQIESWVKTQNRNNFPFARGDVQNYISNTWKISVTLKTCGNILARLKLTRKRCQIKPSGIAKSNPELHTEYMDFITQMKKKNLFYRHSSEIRSIDVTCIKKLPPVLPHIHQKEVVNKEHQPLFSHTPMR